jgi:hypothetical protein
MKKWSHWRAPHRIPVRLVMALLVSFSILPAAAEPFDLPAITNPATTDHLVGVTSVFI